MESLLKDIYSLIYGKLQLVDICSLAYSCPAAYRAALLHLRSCSYVETYMYHLRTGGMYCYLPLMLACARVKAMSQELISAIEDNDSEAVSIYLRAGADPTLEDCIALEKAITCESDRMVWMLLATGRIPPMKCSLLLEKAVYTTDILRTLLLQPGVQCDVNENAALVTACMAKNNDAVTALLFHNKISGASMKEFDRAFVIAAEYGSCGIIRSFVRDGRISRRAFTEAFVTACLNGHLSTVQVLIADKRADPTASHHTAIYYAAEHSYTGIVKTLLLDRRLDPNVGTLYKTLLNIATRLKDTELEKIITDWKRRFEELRK